MDILTLLKFPRQARDKKADVILPDQSLLKRTLTSLVSFINHMQSRLIYIIPKLVFLFFGKRGLF